MTGIRTRIERLEQVQGDEVTITVRDIDDSGLTVDEKKQMEIENPHTIYAWDRTGF